MGKNYFSHVFLLSLLAFMAGTLTAQPQATPKWTAVYTGTGDNSDRFNKVISDGSGNFVGVGYTIKKGNYRDILVVKFDAAGDTLWWRTKNGSGNGDDEAFGVDVDASGNVYVAATVDGGNLQDNIMTLKFAGNGTVLWDTTWNNSQAGLDDNAVALKIDGNGNCIVGGVSEPDTVSGSSDFVVLKYAPTGMLLWSNIWSRPGIQHGKDELAGIAIDGNNDVYAAGRSFGTTDDFLLLKIDGSAGSSTWQMPYNGSGEDRATALAIDNIGDIVITGSSEIGNNLDYRIIKYNSSGLLQWTKALTAPAGGDDKPNAITIDANNNIYVTGSADVASGSAINLDFQTVKYDAAGTFQWVRRDGGAIQQEDIAYDLVVDASGNVYVTGKSDSNISPSLSDFDYMTIAYTPSGGLFWGSMMHAGSRTNGDDIPSSIVFSGTNVYVGGGAVNTATHKDATVVKYDANSGNSIWVKDYNGTGDFSEDSKAIAVDANDFSYVAGATFVENRNLNACISKIDVTGAILCTYQYSGIKNDDDEFKAIAVSSNGSVYAAGYTKVTDQKRNMLLVKWNPANCDTVWTRTYDYIGQSDRIESMILDNAGNIYVTGRSDGNPADTLDNEDVVTIKYDSNGNVQWLSRWGGAANMRDEPVKIIFDNNGDLVIGGRTENIHDDDFLVLKYNPLDGIMRSGFPATYGGPFANDDRVTDIAVDQSNNIYVAGYSQSGSGNATQDPVILAYDAAGNILTSIFYSYFALGQDEFSNIGFDSFGDLYVLNKFMDGSGATNNYNMLLRKLHSDLTPIWDRTYDSPIHGEDEPKDMVITASGDVYFTGVSDNDTLLSSINKNWITVGYDTTGNRIFYANADGTNLTDDAPDALVIKGTTIWVCGYTENSPTNQKDITVISYDLPLPAGDYDNKLFSVNSNAFPNPFTDNCRISIENGGGQLYFEVYDLLGNRVTDRQSVSGNEITFNRGNLAAGMYQYKILSAKSLVSTGKLIIN